jgi:hypothetical protein
MADAIDKEISAIKEVLAALEPLSSAARTSVLEYAIKRLDIYLPAAAPGQVTTVAPLAASLSREPPNAPQEVPPTHIRTFKEQKKPRSANEMAALVGYYLANLAPSADRKAAVNTKDIETYFKIADFPLPEVKFTLPNAKNAGYFDAAGDGAYKLNAVGHNLVVHGLPRGSDGTQPTRKKRRKSKVKSQKRK